MSRRTRIIALAVAAAVLALFIGVYAGVLNTGMGRRAVLDALKPTLNEAVGGEVRIGGTGGHWPHHIVLREVTIADKEGVWLDVPALTVRWNPLDLIWGRISIGELTIPVGTLSRIPEGEDTEPEAPGLPRLPHLPDLGIGSLTVGTLKLGPDVAGSESVLRLTGSADMRADILRLVLKVATEPEGTDKADIEIDWTPADNRLKADVMVEGAQGGLLAQLAGLDEGPLSLAVGGTGPASGWAGTVEARLGSMGGISGTLACTCSVKPQLTMRLEARPGPGLGEDVRRYLGGTPAIEATLFSPKMSAWSFEVTTLNAAAGRLTSPLRVMLTEGWRLLRFDVSGGVEIGPALESALPLWLGKAFEVSGRGAFGDSGSLRLAAASVSSETVRLDLKDARRTAAGALEGGVKVSLLSAESTPAAVTELAGERAELSFALSGNIGKTIRLRNVSLQTEAGTAAAGTLAYALDRRIADVELDLKLPPPVFAALTDLPEPPEDVTGHLSAKGPVSDLSASLQAQTPELALDPRPLPPAETTLALTGGMDDPTGKVSIRRLDDPQAPPMLIADIAWPEREILHVTALKAELDGARLEGEAHIATQTGSLTGKAMLKVPDVSALAAGAAGSLSVDLALERAAAGALVLTAAAAAPQLSYGGYGANELKIDASGPVSKLTVSVWAGEVAVPGTGSVRDLDSTGIVTSAGATDIALNKFTATLDGTAIALREPARVSLKEGTTEIQAVKFSWGEAGSLTAAATLAPDDLKASLEMIKAAIPGQSILASGSVKVDTAQERPGIVDLRLDPRGGAQVFMKIEGIWNGQAVNLTGVLQGYGERAKLGRNEILTAGIPLSLSRTEEGLSLDSTGRLDAALKYQGRMGALTAVFLTEEESLLNGDFTADIRVTGTLAAPEAKGSATLSRGRYENVDEGIVLNAIDARLDFAGGVEAARGTLKLTAWDGGDPGSGRPPVMGEGQVRLDPDGLRVNADLRLRKAELIQRGDFEATLSGTANLAGRFPKLALTGDLRIDKMDLLIPENQPEGIVDVPVVLVNEQGEPLDPEEEETNGDRDDAFELALNAKVRSDGQAFVRGRGLDSEWKADISVGGTIDAVKLNGSLNLKKGSLSFAGRKFDLTKGAVTFTGQTPPDPVLDVTAEHETEENVRALVRVSGRTSEPEIALESVPPLPKEDVMALVLFGKPATELTGLQALQVTQSVAQLTGIGPFGGGSIMDRARRTLGLDLLDLTFGKENGEVGLTVGRYVSEGVFVSASQDVTGEGGKVSVEVEITDEFSVKTDVGQDASGNVSAQWKKDY